MAKVIHVGFDSKDFTKRPGKLIIDDPMSQPGLSETVERGTRPATYVNGYVSVDYVRCAFCDTHQPHRHGFTVEMEDGRTALCGNKCAEEFFGKEVARSLRKDLEKRVDLQKKRELLDRTFHGLERLGRAFTEDVVIRERKCREMVSLMRSSFPEVVLKKIEAGDARGIHGSAVSLMNSSTFHSEQMVSEKIIRLIGFMEKAVSRRDQMDENGVRNAVQSRQRLMKWIGEIVDFSDSISRFMDPRSLANLCELHLQQPRDYGSITLVRPVTGPELHIIPYEGRRFRCRLDGMKIISGDVVALLRESQPLD